MSYNPGSLVTCPNLQMRLEEAFAIQNPADVTIPSPFLQFLMSDTNRGGLQQAISPGNGKIRTVTTTWKQRALGSSVTVNAVTPTCTATDKVQQFYENYTLDPDLNMQVNLLIDPNDSRYACQDGESLMLEDLALKLNALDEAIAQKTAQEAVALTGLWGSDVTGVDGSNRLVVRTTRATALDEPYAWTMQEIDTAAEMTAYTQPYGLFGGVTLRNYARRMEAGCCADYGTDIGALFNTYRKAVAYDRWVMEALGSQNEDLMVQSGALQMIWYNEFNGTPGFNTFNSEIYRQQMIVTKSGVPVDLMMNVVCGKIHITATARTKVVGLPADMFPTGDIYDGVKWVNRVLVTN